MRTLYRISEKKFIFDLVETCVINYKWVLAVNTKNIDPKKKILMGFRIQQQGFRSLVYF